MDLTRYVGFYRGLSTTTHANERVQDASQENGLKAAGQESPQAPGVRAEGGLFVKPAPPYMYPPQASAEDIAMLDSTPIYRPISRSSRSRSPRFHEHLAELEDSGSQRALSPGRRGNSPILDSPTVGRMHQPILSSSLADDVRRRQHIMSWNNHQPDVVDDVDDSVEAMIGPRSPPANKSLPSVRSPEKVSPDLSSEPRDSKFVVSPLGSSDGRKAN